MPLTWHDDLQMTVTSGGTGTLTLGSAVSGFQAFAAGDDGKLFSFGIKDGTAFESNQGIYTHSSKTLTRITFGESSTTAALNVSTSATVFVDITAAIAKGMDAAAQGVMAGGGLTLTSGDPTKQADVTGATTIYYTPFVHNVVPLWDGNRWVDTVFSEVTQALGTLSSGKPYDVFGYLNAGALNTELLAWTNDSTRATAVTIQERGYCKSGDKTRLLLGSFYTTSTTATEDSGLNRYVSNAYNQVPATCKTGAQVNSHTYGTPTWREWNNGTSVVRPQWMQTLPTSAPQLSGMFEIAGNGAFLGYGSINVDTVTDDPDESVGNYNTIPLRMSMLKGAGSLTTNTHGNIAAGKHYAAPMEFASGGTCTFSVYWLSVFIRR